MYAVKSLHISLIRHIKTNNFTIRLCVLMQGAFQLVFFIFFYLVVLPLQSFTNFSAFSSLCLIFPFFLSLCRSAFHYKLIIVNRKWKCRFTLLNFLVIAIRASQLKNKKLRERREKSYQFLNKLNIY